MQMTVHKANFFPIGLLTPFCLVTPFTIKIVTQKNLKKQSILFTIVGVKY